MTLGEWLTEAQTRLTTHGIEAARLESQLLAAHVLLVERVSILAHPEVEFPELAGEVLLQRRLSGEPLAYILGWREFFGRRFTVRPGVLIPRQDTEVLIETALRLGPIRPARVLDVGTGSGILPITLKLERPAWNLTAVDLSPVALEIASENAETLGAEITLLKSDLFEAVQDKFDLIVSNPPYVADNDPLPIEVRDFEPHLALFAGPTGLDVYHRLSKEAHGYLKTGGQMLLEIGLGQLHDVSDIFQNQGWEIVESVQDLSRIPRVIAVKSLL